MKMPGNMQAMMQQAQKMQQKMQEEIALIRVEASAGGGMVTVKMDGHKNVTGVKIDICKTKIAERNFTDGQRESTDRQGRHDKRAATIRRDLTYSARAILHEFDLSVGDSGSGWIDNGSVDLCSIDLCCQGNRGRDANQKKTNKSSHGILNCFLSRSRSTVR